MNKDSMFIIDDATPSSNDCNIEDVRNSLVEILKNFMPHDDMIKESSVGHFNK